MYLKLIETSGNFLTQDTDTTFIFSSCNGKQSVIVEIEKFAKNQTTAVLCAVFLCHKKL